MCLIFSAIILTSVACVSAGELGNNSLETNIVENNSLNEIHVDQIQCEKNSSLISSENSYSDDYGMDFAKENPVSNMSENSTSNLVKNDVGNASEVNKKSPTVTYDDLSNVSMSKDNVNFYLKNSADIRDLFSFINKNHPWWDYVNITLAPHTVFKIDFRTYCCKFNEYALRFSGKMQINGEQGSVIEGNNKLLIHSTL